MNSDFLKKLRILGTVEGISTLILFGIAMPLKYFADMPLAVRIVGTLHGVLFIALAVMFIRGIRAIPMPAKMAALGIAGAVVPFGPFIVDRWLADLESPPAVD